MPGSTTACSVISSRRSSAPSNKAGKQGRIADRSAEAQQFRASGLNLVIAAIVFWNSTYIATPSPISVRLNNRCLRTEQRILVGAPPDLRRSGRLGRSNVGGEQ
jgi:Tn3 transposase DDE domain